MPKRVRRAASATVPSENADVVTLQPQITNATAWEYPLEFHTAICNTLGVNPRIWILPDGFQALITAYTEERQDDVDAYADELNNVVFFWNDDWTDLYRRWVIAHELWHIAQFFDKGNQRAARWRGMSAKERDRVWEREAINFANTSVQGVVHKDFSAYKSRSTIIPRKRRGKKTHESDGGQSQGSSDGSREVQQARAV